MKFRLAYQQILWVLAALSLAQFACSFGAQPPAVSTQPPPSSGLQATLPPAGGGQPTREPPAGTSAHGTPEEAKAMLQKAVQHYLAVGRTQALADFTGRVAPFFDRDLYVACIDSQLKQSANGGFPNLVGSPVEPLSRAAWDAATTNRIDAINYAYIDPANGQTLPKTLYYEKVGSDVCGVGAYHP